MSYNLHSILTKKYKYKIDIWILSVISTYRNVHWWGLSKNIRKSLSTCTRIIYHLISQEKGTKVSRLWRFWSFKIAWKSPIRTVESYRKSAFKNFHFFPVLVKTQLKRGFIKCNFISFWSFRNSLERGFMAQSWVPIIAPWEKSTLESLPAHGLARQSSENNGTNPSFRGAIAECKSDPAFPSLDKQDPGLSARGSGVQQLNCKTMWPGATFTLTSTSLVLSVTPVFTFLPVLLASLPQTDSPYSTWQPLEPN